MECTNNQLVIKACSVVRQDLFKKLLRGKMDAKQADYIFCLRGSSPYNETLIE